MPAAAERTSREPPPELSSLGFTNRELSFLEFNQLIVEEAQDPSVPLLERVKFLSIVSSNLDEFFMIRVAGLKQQQKSGVLETGPDGMLPQEQLNAICERVARQVEDQERIFLEDVLPSLAREGLHLLREVELPVEDAAFVEAHFDRKVFPMLTPMAVDPGHPFPILRNRSQNLAVFLVPERAPDERFPLLAVVQVPLSLPRFVELSRSEGRALVFLEDVIYRFIGKLFPGMRILECVPFRVIRNWDLKVDEDEQEDLIEAVEKELQRRGRLDAVRLEIRNTASESLVEELRKSLSLVPQDVQRHRGPLALVDLDQFVSQTGRSDLRDESFQPVLSQRLRDAEDLFGEIARGDILLHHPYESYEPVIELLTAAALDPNVLAIKQTLYRVTRNSPILSALVGAAENGKQVTALVEIKARFDEEANVEWARALEDAGVHVVYGMIGLKTHCKVTLVVRRESAGVRSYVHIGTGNYNEKSARIYSDLSLFTAEEAVSSDITALFNLLTGYSSPPSWKKLVVAPLDLRRRLLELIGRTQEGAKRGEKSRIVMKSNALIDPQVIRALVDAARAGVDVQLLVRGPCSLKVGIPGLTDERIQVRTLVDRFLEHSRVFYFRSGDQEEVFITSTDVMPRNFDRRVEVMIPIENETLKRRVIDEILGAELRDNQKASELAPDGRYVRVPKSGTPFRAQAHFMELARQRAQTDQEQAEKRRKRKKKRRRAPASGPD